MVLFGTHLAMALDTIHAHFDLLKLLFDPHEHHPELGDEETCRQLRKLYERLVDSQLNILFSDENDNERFVYARYKVFERIYLRLKDALDAPAKRWWRLVPRQFRGNWDVDDQNVPDTPPAILRCPLDESMKWLQLLGECYALFIPDPPPKREVVLRRRLLRSYRRTVPKND